MYVESPLEIKERKIFGIISYQNMSLNSLRKIRRERWIEEHILTLPAGEHDYFERKGGAILADKGFRKDLAKALSAFANTGGGLLILGIDICLLEEISMFINLEQDFNLFYKVSSKEAKALAGATAKEFYANSENSDSFTKRLLHRLRFRPNYSMLYVFVISTLAFSSAAIALRYLRNIIGPWSDIILESLMLLIEVFFLVFTFTIVWLAERTSASVNLFERKMTTANLIIEKWIERKHDLGDLMLAFKSSLNTLRFYRELYVGVVFIVGALLNFFKLLVGDDSFFRSKILALTGITLSPYAFTITFFLIAVCAYAFISVPIKWREQIEPYLTRGLEKNSP